MGAISWSIGAKVTTQHGKSEVIAVDGEVFTFKGEDGIVFTFDTTPAKDKNPKSKGITKHRAREIDTRLLHPSVIGFLAGRAEMFAEIRVSKKDWFQKAYKYPTEGLEDGRLMFIETNKWGEEFRVKFVASEKEITELGLAGLTKADHGDPLLRVVNCNLFWWHLVRMGFRMGGNHDVGKIRESIGVGGREDFEYWLTGQAAA